MKIYLFIRNDDVKRMDRSFLSVFRLFKAKRIPVIYGVIPGLIDKQTIDFLNREKQRTPHLFDIVQHGWKHKNYSFYSKKRCEFGAKRSYALQLQDIKQGLSVMKKEFKAHFTFAFVPPYHGYNKTTLQIINELRFPIFSAGKRITITDKYFRDLPATISLNKYSLNGSPLSMSAKEMINVLMRKIPFSRGLIGMVMHHRAFVSKPQLAELRVFLSFLEKLRAEGKIQFIRFSDFSKRKK